MLDDPIAWAPALVTLGVFLSLAALSPADPLQPLARAARVFAALFTGVLTLRYVAWRLDALPPPQSWLQDAWVIVFLVAEMLNHLSNLLALFFLSRTCNRSAEADAASGSSLLQAPTDVFIATYNEPSAVLERTMIGAMAIDHPDLRVWVLDDGGRSWVKDMAERLGAHYLSRTDRSHAKAGNVNNGLRHALATGRRPAFILLLDADFVANQRILKRTLGLFDTPDVGIVQTPQHFFNPDPVQANLGCRDVWPDEQRFFFNVLLPSKDAWGAAFCCGTSAVLRVAALEAIGGLATETVTEDMLTSFKMREHGWRTIFLNERLSLGLAPEGLGEYVSQRGRWCLGGIQQLHTRWSPFGRGRIGLINRISCFDSALYWTASFPFKLMMLAGPAIYWLTGTTVLAAPAEDLIYWLMPSVLATILFMAVYGRNLIVPVMTDITQLLSAVVVMINVVNGFLRPHGRPFKVTDKGVSRERITIHWRFMWPFLAIAAATLIGMGINLSSSGPLVGHSGYTVNALWSAFNVAVLLLVCVACIDLPRRRGEERFLAEERGVVVWPGGSGIDCHVLDISLAGARLVSGHWNRIEDQGELALDGYGPHLPFRVLRRSQQEVIVSFSQDLATRRSLVGRLFNGDYAREVEDVKMHRVLANLLRRLLD